MINFNKTFHAIASAQGVEPGSPEWVEGGLAAWGGQTGSHPAYGWKHEHRYNEIWARWVVANYLHRSGYYELSKAELEIGKVDKRELGYADAGRPLNLTEAELQYGDLPDGQTVYFTSAGIVKVSGPDLLHFHIGPLLVVYDKNPQIKTPDGVFPARVVLGPAVQFLMSSMAGQIRTGMPLFMGDRGIACIIHCMVEAAKRNLIFKDDVDTVHKWLLEHVIPFYEQGPGHCTGVKGFGGFQVFNGLYWTLPAFYDLYRVLPESDMKDRVYKIVKRKSNWISDLQEMKPDLNIYQVDITDEAILTLDEAPMSIKPYVKLQDNVGGGTDWSEWAYRAACVAGKVLDRPDMVQTMAPVLAKWKAEKKYDHNQWLVDADNNYV